KETMRRRKNKHSKLPATRMSRFFSCSWMRGPRAEAPERTPKAEVRRSLHGAQDSKRKEFLLQQERRRRGLDLFGYFLGQAKKVTPGEGADSPFKNKYVFVFILLRIVSASGGRLCGEELPKTKDFYFQ
ncbi:MAG: hypothetical protein ACK46Z_07510, partial [Bacteroidota bacterium]